MNARRIFAKFPLRLQSLASRRAAHLAFRFLSAASPAEFLDLGYAALADRVELLAAGLNNLGLRGERALILHEPGPDFVESLLACMRAGVIAVPIQPSRGWRLAERIEGVIADSNPRCGLGPEANNSTTRLPRISPDALVRAARDRNADFDPPGVDDIAILQYTSGSTARPRGVVLKHSNIEANSERIAERFHYDAGLRGVCWLPPYHDMGLIGGILQPIWAGGCELLMDPSTLLRRPSRWLRAITDFKGTSTAGPNFAYELCVTRTTDAEIADFDLSTLETALVGAEPVRPATLDRFHKRFGACGFRKEAFCPSYGLAENTLMVSGVGWGEAPRYAAFDGVELGRGRAIPAPAAASNAVRFCSSGPPIADHAVKIAGPEGGELDDGGVGEVWVSGPSVAHGYFRRPEECLETFTDSWLRTGDLGVRIDGELYIVGRLKDVVIVNGRKLHSEDIESVIRDADPLLAEGACVAFAETVEGRERLMVAIESSRGVDPFVLKDSGSIVRRAIFNAFGMSVDRVAFAPPLSFPRTSSGKVQRKRCRTALQNGEIECVFTDQSLRSFV